MWYVTWISSDKVLGAEFAEQTEAEAFAATVSALEPNNALVRSCHPDTWLTPGNTKIVNGVER